MSYLVLLLGTPYMDGKYFDKEDAIEAAESFEEDYKGIKAQVVSCKDNLIITDEIFWRTNRVSIEAINDKKLRERRA